MTLEEYKKKKLEKVDHIFNGHPIMRRKEMLELMSQTIDELWAIPFEKHYDDEDEEGEYEMGWNACIDEAERMRDNKLSEKR